MDRPAGGASGTGGGRRAIAAAGEGLQGDLGDAADSAKPRATNLAFETLIGRFGQYGLRSEGGNCKRGTEAVSGSGGRSCK
jgi:hypothetical protein